MHTLLIGVIIGNVNGKPGGLFNLWGNSAKEVAPKSEVGSLFSVLEPLEIPTYRNKFKPSNKCRTMFYRVAFICTITTHYEYHEEVKLSRADLQKLDRRLIQQVLCPCPQGNVSPFCPKFVSNFLYNYRHEKICTDEYDLNLPLY